MFIDENEKLKSVLTLIDSRIKQLSDESESLSERLKLENQDMWEDIKRQILRGEVDEYDEMIEILQNATNLELAENRAYENIEELKSLVGMKNSPYFGRIDFLSDLYDDELNVYIGIRSIYDNEGDFAVFDWRSPIASMYYDNEPGKAGYDAPNGRIEGVINLKRQYKIEKAKLIYFFDTEVNIDDVILSDALSGNADTKLKVIVSTIQKEQNSVIRKELYRNLLVTGPAGCGKTSIAMHRLAYMLYKHKNRIKSKNILLITENNLFGSYIADILPSLGEQSCAERSIYNLVCHNIPEEYAVEDYYIQAEALLEGDAERRYDSILKSKPEFLAKLTSAIVDKKPIFEDVVIFGETVVSASTLASRYESEIYAPVKKLQRLIDYTEAELREYFVLNFDSLKKKICTEPYMTEQYSLYTRKYQMECEASAADMLRKAIEIDPIQLYADTINDLGDEGCSERVARRISDKRLGYDDALAICYAMCVYGSAALDDELIKSDINMVVIDEAQDYSPLQHLLMKKLFPRAIFNILADVNQALIPEINTTDSEELVKIYRAEHARLGKSYRQTEQIANFALGFTDNKYEIFTRQGEAVRFIKSGECVKAVCAEIENAQKSERICVVTRTRKQSAALYKEAIAMNGKLTEDASLISDSLSSSDKKVIFTSVLFTKGMEFDKVVIVLDDETKKLDEASRRVLYMMSTRALHKLSIVYDGELPESISRAESV